MKPFSRITKFLGLGFVVLVAIGLIARAVADSRASNRLEERLSRLRSAGKPLRFADLESKPIPPEQNAATYLNRAREATQAIDKEVDDALENQSEDDQKLMDNGQLTDTMQASIRSALDAYPNVLPLLEQAAACPDYEPQWTLHDSSLEFIDSIIKQAGPTRSVIRTLRYRALLQLADSQPEAAVQTALLMYRLSRHFDKEPAIVGLLVAIACRGLAADVLNHALRSGPISDESRKAIDEELARHDLIKVYRGSLTTERVVGLESLGDRYPPGFPAGAALVWPAMAKNAQCDYLDFLDEADSVVSRNYRVASAVLQKPRSSVGGALLQPGMLAAQVAVSRGQVFLRAARVFNAIQRYEMAHPDVQPQLSDLELPPDVTTDPFNGQPLIVKRQPEGWLVYSVGRNLKDDGGDIATANDDGLGPIKLSSHQPEAQTRENGD